MNISNKIFKILFIIIAFSFLSCRNDSDNIIIIKDNFKTAIGYVNDTVKDAINYDYKFERNKIKNKENFPNNEGIVWIKREFSIPENLMNSPISLFIEEISTADETYFNGEYIGRTGITPYRDNHYFSFWNVPRYYSIPKKFVKKNNILLVKVYLYYETYFPNKLILGKEKDIKNIYSFYHFFRIEINSLIAIVLLFAFGLFLLIFIKRPKDKESLYYAIICFSFAIYQSNFFISKFSSEFYSKFSYLSFQKIVFSVCGIGGYFMLLFINEYLNRIIKKLESILYFLIILVPSFIIIISPTYEFFMSFRGTYLLIALVLPVLYGVILITFYAIKNNRMARVILIGYIPFVLCILSDVIFNQILEYEWIYLSGYGMPAFIISISYILANNFVNDRNEAEELNITLDIKVAERTEELVAANEEMKAMNENLIETKDELEAANEEMIAMNENLLETQKQLWGEMQIAKKIQTVLLPKDPKMKGYEILSFMEPADDVGGDYYDIINYKGYDWFVIGDVSGHGVSAGLVMMMVQTAIHTFIQRHPDSNPSEVLAAVNEVIYNNLQRIEDYKYMTITIFAVFEEGNFVFSGLHQDILIHRKKTGTIDRIETEGIWIGLYDYANPDNLNLSFSIETGDTLLVYTDGITEAWKANSIINKRDPKFDMFGIKRLIDVFQQNADSTNLEEIKDAILNSLNDFDYDDDITFVLLRRIE